MAPRTDGGARAHRQSLRRYRRHLQRRSFPILQADFAIFRERILRAADACFGHRLMRDRIIPGGVTQNVAPGSLDGITALIETIRGKLPEMVERL